MNRGSARTTDARSGPWISFNEAPIHESGKYQTYLVVDFSDFPLQ